MPSSWDYFVGVEQAIVYAMESHKGTFRKDSIEGHSLPYIFHPLEVIKCLWGWGIGNELMMRAAALHDVLEDCPQVTLTSFQGARGFGIMDVFGKSVADLVVELTLAKNPDWTPEQSRKAKIEYMESFANKSLSALSIKLADRFCNVRDFMLTNPKYAYKYFRKADPVYTAAFNRRQEFLDAYGKDC